MSEVINISVETVPNGNPLLPTAGEKAAMAGSSGSPSSVNKFVTENGLNILDEDLQSQMDAEVLTRHNDDDALSSRIDDAVQSIIAITTTEGLDKIELQEHIETVQDNLDAEVLLARTNEGIIQGSVTAETNRATAAESAARGLTASEETRAKAAEVALGGRIDHKADLDTNGLVPLSQLPDRSGSNNWIVSDYTERDALTTNPTVHLKTADRAIVYFGPGNVEGFIWNSVTSAWFQDSDTDWVNLNVPWSALLDKPGSTVAQIDDAVAKAHSHTNKSVIDQISQQNVTDFHAHSNKTLLDSLDQTNAAIKNAVDKAHGVNDPNSSHYTKNETYTMNEINGYLAAKSDGTHVHSFDNTNINGVLVQDSLDKKINKYATEYDKHKLLNIFSGSWKTPLTDATIVDIFIYDTKKDSIPDTWRHSPQLSWYLECGKFPEVAVIVGTTTKLYFYDYETGSLWMRFDIGAYSYLYDYISAISMLNGRLFVGFSNGTGRFSVTSFVEDRNIIQGYSNYVNLPITGRNNTISGNRIGGATYSYQSLATVHSIFSVVIASKQYVAIGNSGGISIINETDNKVISSIDTSKFIKVWIANGYLYAIKDQNRSVYRSSTLVISMDWASLTAFSLTDILMSGIYPCAKGVYCDGTAKNLSIPDNPAINIPSTPFSVEIVFDVPANVENDQYIFAKNINNLGLALYNGSIYLRCGGSNWTAVNISSYARKTIHLVAGWDGTNEFMYINGSLRVNTARSTNLPVTNTSTLIIGTAGGGVNYSGRILSFRLWNYALSSARIYDLSQGLAVTSDDKWGSGNLIPSASSDFATDGTGYYTKINGALTWNSGTTDATFVKSGTSYGFIEKSSLLTVGTRCRVSFRAKSSNYTGNIIWFGNADLSIGALTNAYVYYTLDRIADFANLRIGVGSSADGVDFTIDDIVVTKLGCNLELLADNFISGASPNTAATWPSSDKVAGNSSGLVASAPSFAASPSSVNLPCKYTIDGFPKSIAADKNGNLMVGINNILADFPVTTSGTTTTNVVSNITTTDLYQYVGKYIMCNATGEIQQITAQTNGANAQFTTNTFATLPSGNAKIINNATLEGGVVILGGADA